MAQLADPEDAAQEFVWLDSVLESIETTLVVTFDTVDGLSRDWHQGKLLRDTLFEVVSSVPTFRHGRAEVFARPEPFVNETLKIIEPKLRSASVKLNWTRTAKVLNSAIADIGTGWIQRQQCVPLLTLTPSSN